MMKTSITGIESASWYTPLVLRGAYTDMIPASTYMVRGAGPLHICMDRTFRICMVRTKSHPCPYDSSDIPASEAGCPCDPDPHQHYLRRDMFHPVPKRV